MNTAIKSVTCRVPSTHDCMEKRLQGMEAEQNAQASRSKAMLGSLCKSQKESQEATLKIQSQLLSLAESMAYFTKNMGTPQSQENIPPQVSPQQGQTPQPADQIRLPVHKKHPLPPILPPAVNAVTMSETQDGQTATDNDATELTNRETP